MALQYEVIDTHNPRARGQRYGTVERALRYWGDCVPRDRFAVIDRTTGAQVQCAWFLLCDNPATTTRPVSFQATPVPICTRCNDKMNRIENLDNRKDQ